MIDLKPVQGYMAVLVVVYDVLSITIKSKINGLLALWNSINHCMCADIVLWNMLAELIVILYFEDFIITFVTPEIIPLLVNIINLW